MMWIKPIKKSGKGVNTGKENEAVLYEYNISLVHCYASHALLDLSCNMLIWNVKNPHD